MGRGNVCTTGKYEGLYYIDNDDYYVYTLANDLSDSSELRLMRDLSYEELTGADWSYDELETESELDDIKECFIAEFIKLFPSFERVDKTYISASRLAILENKLFYICMEDNEWSIAVELIQREDPYDDHLVGLQKRHYERYLDGIKKCLLRRLPSISYRCGAWTSGTIHA